MTNRKKHNLEERTGKFGEDIIEFAKKFQKIRAETMNLIFKFWHFI